MPLTAIDPIAALLVVDLQKGLVDAPLVHPIGTIVERAKTLADAFRARHLPVVLINVAGVAPGRTEQPRRDANVFSDDFCDFIAELDQQPNDIVVTKQTWGAFAHTDLEQRLKSIGVTQVVVTGVATGTGVESTARQAYEAGFHVTVAIDAMTDTRPDAHDYSIAKVFPRLGETGTVQEIVQMLAKGIADHAVA